MVTVARRLQQRQQSASKRDLRVARAREHRSVHCVQPVHPAQHGGICGLRIGGPRSGDGARVDECDRRRLVLALQRRM
eukprot:3670201-Prymnesium_polylepis.1